MRVSTHILALAATLLPSALAASPSSAVPKSVATGDPTGAIGTNCDFVSTVTVKAGDGLANIATAAKVTLDQVLFVNKNITNARLINPGDVTSIPNAACVAPTIAPLAEPTATCSNGTATTTQVVSGDTLSIIAKEKLGITLPALLAANPQITNPHLINVGDNINIPLYNSKAAAPAAAAGGANSRMTSAPPMSSKAPKPTVGATDPKASKAPKAAATGAPPAPKDGPKAAANGTANAPSAKASTAPKASQVGVANAPKAVADPPKAAGNGTAPSPPDLKAAKAPKAAANGPMAAAGGMPPPPTPPEAAGNGTAKAQAGSSTTTTAVIGDDCSVTEIQVISRIKRGLVSGKWGGVGGE